MRVKFWGVRGSIPTPGPTTVRYGGNTSCVEVQGEKDECIILDAGTGLRLLGIDLLERAKPLPTLHLFISHTHWDHIQGFPFFAPCYIPGTEIHVKGPVHFLEYKTLKDIFDNQMQYEFFPISNQQLAAHITYETLDEKRFEIGNFTLQSQFANHPIRSLSYKLEENGRIVVYTGDHEPYFNIFDDPYNHLQEEEEDDDDILFGDIESAVKDANRRFIEFIRDADLLIVDCQFTPEEYPSEKRNWGHSSWNYCLEWMKIGGIKQMALTHHDPMRTDEALDNIIKSVHKEAEGKGLDPEKILMAQEGMEVLV
ncbi:MAG: MBL fold metallo-hydrolase [bacterium]